MASSLEVRDEDCMFMFIGLLLYTAVASLEGPDLLLSYSMIAFYDSISIAQHHHTNNNP